MIAEEKLGNETVMSLTNVTSVVRVKNFSERQRRKVEDGSFLHVWNTLFFL